MNKPKCAVGGMPRKGVACGAVIVGGQLCGYKGECEHQRPSVEAAKQQAEYCGYAMPAELARALGSAKI